MAMNERYEPQAIEGKWQARWDEAGIFRAGERPGAPKKYVLEMLPYPSGKMHMGHVRNYLIGDVYARYFLMRGYDVLHPMGWDAFGLPAENAAIKDGVHPAIRTQENIVSFKAEMKSLGYSYDWSREVNTSQPEYYRWNQWFFIKMLEKGLVYRRFSKVNWCTGCHTVIANEQVKDGVCERCSSPVVDREMPEWAFRITAFSQDLLDALDTLKEWPDRITSMQRNWIGRSDGAEADFRVQGHDASIRVFTTRVDTIHGCTYVVLAPDHKLVAQVTTPERRADVDAFVKKMAAQSKTERTGEDTEKEGVFTGAHALNPFTGQPVPVWIANFVLSDYGTGAVMSVPAHDERDFAFARKYSLPVKVVIQPATGDKLPAGDVLEAAYTEYGVLVDSGEYSGKTSEAARQEMARKLESEGKGRATVTYRQKDWGFSRQRYWGTPIPIVYCEKCDPERHGIPVPEAQLPVKLPEIDVQEVLTGKGEPPLAKVASWVNTTCPKCGGPARREAETMDTFVDSCWYFARYLSPHYDAAPFDPKEAQRFLPVDIYVGGPEHAVMHLLYFRFWTRVMKLLGLSPVDEPVKRLITQGIVNGPDKRKMSKRWGNVVAPASIIEKYGADTARAYVAFAGPPERDFDWSDAQVEGVFRFLKRVWVLASTHQAAVAGATHAGPFEGKALEIRRAAHKGLKRVGEAIERLSFNTAIAGIMECLNALSDAGTPETPAEKAAMAEAVRLLSMMLTPFAPHIADEIAEAYGSTQLTVSQSWPEFDPALVVDDVIPYAVQVNGKLRAEIQVAADASEADVRAAAEADERVKSAITGKTLRKFVFVPKRLVNFVVG
ncbi:leucine--tRNA ligase [Myxococcus sp. K38C18041901]|uniref:leucine--tRNA ligase n=1 Tax=Myxococcus guangdongensis TaxID=2906760 RepID=UPI0020A7A1B9|nr:leucine--tRNA ligase [Myxococcus guangdongensis]MCP3057192.1 leucine--tRNA ligase [Myxococcus guangdongensis]